ncbi:hypothetical protein [Desulfatiglans anilini]|uniref:hypothetical protein n=1 Tax=Desulfatiglans anilini TaxID=90728 RepID=UPI0003FBD05D|nr:hypothetical protein [Desulfatiglans anilini]
MRIEFFPERLDAALGLVRTKHPVRGSGLIEPSQLLCDQVREKLVGTPDEAIERLAFDMSASELAACLEIVIYEREKEVAEKASRIVLLRPKEKIIRRAWFRLIRMYPNDLLEETLKTHFLKEGYDAILSANEVSDRVIFWFREKTLGSGVAKDLARSKLNIRLNEYLDRSFLSPEAGLHKEAWRWFLLHAEASSLLKERAETILSQWGRVENAAYLAAFCQHYLNEIHELKEWQEPILEFIERRFGEPSADIGKGTSETPFWRDVSSAAKGAFRKWLMIRHVEAFFEGDRAEFWKKFLNAGFVERVREILNREGFMIDFGSFGVIEFKNIGNAAYVYPRDIFVKYWNRSDSLTKAIMFKQKSKTIKHRDLLFWDGRIIHKRGWQADTYTRISKLLGV